MFSADMDEWPPSNAACYHSSHAVLRSLYIRACSLMCMCIALRCLGSATVLPAAWCAGPGKRMREGNKLLSMLHHLRIVSAILDVWYQSFSSQIKGLYYLQTKLCRRTHKNWRTAA